MLNGKVPFKELVEKVPADGAFGQAICGHIPGVKPNNALKSPVVKQLPEKLNMAQQRLLCCYFNKGGTDSSEHGLGIHIE